MLIYPVPAPSSTGEALSDISSAEMPRPVYSSPAAVAWNPADFAGALTGADSNPPSGEVSRVAIDVEDAIEGTSIIQQQIAAVIQGLGYHRESQSWYPALRSRLDGLRELAPGWDGYEAPAPSANARFWASEALLVLASGEGCPPQRLAPSVEGGIALSWRLGSRDANIEFFNNGEIYAATTEADSIPYIWEVEPSRQGLIRSLETIREHIQSQASRTASAG